MYLSMAMSYEKERTRIGITDKNLPFVDLHFNHKVVWLIKYLFQQKDRGLFSSLADCLKYLKSHMGMQSACLKGEKKLALQIWK